MRIWQSNNITNILYFVASIRCSDYFRKRITISSNSQNGTSFFRRNYATWITFHDTRWRYTDTEI